MSSKMDGKLSHFTRGDKAMKREVYRKAVMSQLTGAIQLKNREGGKSFLFLRSGI